MGCLFDDSTVSQILWIVFFLSSVGVTVMVTEFRMKPSILIDCDGAKEDLEG